MKRSACLPFLILFVGILFTTSFAAEVTLFGPEKYERQDGDPDVYTDIFSATAGEGMLIVKNGEPSGEKRGKNDHLYRVSSCLISFNGELVLGPNDFNQNIYHVEIPVNLAEENAISVELRSKPGNYISIKVTGAYPSPTVNLQSDPTIIQLGESSTLTWTSTDADSCSIDNGIGSLDTSGSLEISPTETTVYTITGTGPGGTATASATVTVNHPLPTVNIFAIPGSIMPGESTTLSWTTEYADSISIDNGIGPVATSGSLELSPTETTTYAITATGPGGAASSSATVTVTPPVSLFITSPSDGDIVSRRDVTVFGTVTNTTGSETGVTVNDLPAYVYGDQFVLDHVSLVSGENPISATASDSEGNTVNKSITVYSEPPEQYISVLSNVRSGISPLETELLVRGSFTFTDSSLTYTGPGTVEIFESASDKYRVRITGEGTYFLTAEVIGSGGVSYTDTVTVVIFDQSEIDALLRDKWDQMKDALMQGNIESALGHFAPLSRDGYHEAFTFLSDEIADIIGAMRDIELIYMKENIAKYRITREETIQGQAYDITYYIYFSRDIDGLWHIYNF